MLVYSKDKVYPKVVNMLTLEAGEGYVYIQKGTYDQALILKVKQGFDSMLTLLDCGDNNAEAMVFAFENLPEPVNFLAPFLGLVKEEIPADMETIVGVLHVITTSISPYNFIKKPKEIRKTLEFSGSVLKEYQEPWKAFHLQCVREDMVTIGMPFPVYNQMGVYPQVPSLAAVGNQVVQEQYVGAQVSTGENNVERGLEAGTEVDLTREDLMADPAWEDCGDGLWFNNQTGAMISIEDGDEESLEDEFAAMLAETAEEVEEEEVAPVVQKSTATSPRDKLAELKAKAGLK